MGFAASAAQADRGQARLVDLWPDFRSREVARVRGAGTLTGGEVVFLVRFVRGLLWLSTPKMRSGRSRKNSRPASTSMNSLESRVFLGEKARGRALAVMSRALQRGELEGLGGITDLLQPLVNSLESRVYLA